MRKFVVVCIESPNDETVSVDISDEVEFIPKIREEYEFKGMTYRCVEHHVGRATLKTDKIIVKLNEVF